VVPHVTLGTTLVVDFLAAPAGAPSSRVPAAACPVHGPACGVDLSQLAAPTPAQLAAPKPYHHKGKLLRALGAVRGQVVLDVGCREAPIAHVLAGDNAVIGVDICPQGMLTGRPNALDKGYAALLVADAMRLPLADATVDVVIATDLLEHFVDPPALVDELARVLRPGGRLLASVPNLVSYNNRLSILAGSGVGIELHQLLQGGRVVNPITGPRYPDQDQHLRWFTSRSLATMLALRGLRVRRRLGYDPVLSRLGGLDRLLRNSCQVAAVLAVKP
jgi:SAM-dependent methyltransferase